MSESKELEVKEAAAKKAQELSGVLNVPVHPLVFKDDDGNFITGFIKEPARHVKLAVLDKSVMGGYSAASEMLGVILLKEHSDPRLSSERPEDDKLYLGAVMSAYDLVKFSVNQFKKK
jgi:hypothetical protein